MIGLTVSVPIFNNRQTKSAVEKAQFQYNSSLLNLQDKQKGFTPRLKRSGWMRSMHSNNMQQLKWNWKAARPVLIWSVNSSDWHENTVELLTEKNNLLSAQQQRVQAKYMAILNRTLLDFYAGKDIEL